MILVSGAEPSQFHHLGPLSNATEQYGVDFLWATPSGLVGVQRKAFPSDLLASLDDGRLGKELAQMADLSKRVVILEGQPMFTDEGDLMFSYGSMTARALNNIEFSLQANHGVTVFWTNDHAHTAQRIEWLHDYTVENKPSSLMARSGKSGWGDPGTPGFAVYMLECVPGVGHKKAQAVVEAFGGKLPVKWTGERSELLKVPGIGPKNADAIIKAFGGNE